MRRGGKLGSKLHKRARIHRTIRPAQIHREKEKGRVSDALASCGDLPYLVHFFRHETITGH